MLLLTAEQKFMELPYINVNHVEKSIPATGKSRIMKGSTPGFFGVMHT